MRQISRTTPPQVRFDTPVQNNPCFFLEVLSRDGSGIPATATEEIMPARLVEVAEIYQCSGWTSGILWDTRPTSI